MSDGVDVVGDLVLISVDDHVIEPPGVWQDRVPRAFRDRAPRIVLRDVGPQDPMVPERYRREMVQQAGGTEFWAYEDLLIPTSALSVSAGRDRKDYSFDPLRYEQMRPGCYDPHARLADMDLDGVTASLNFPTFPRLAGQTFLEAKDRELALLCVRAYNDWMLDEWCAADPGRFIPCCIVPLWDPHLAANELQRVAANGARAITFSENPAKLGQPSIHSGHWDPLFAAAADANIPLCLHIGSSSDTIITATDAPMSIYVGLVPFNAQITCFDWLLSGVFVKHPNLRIVLSEGGIGWIPYILERADYTWEHQGAWTGTATTVPEPPSTYFANHIYACFIADNAGITNIDHIGPDNVMIEVDYPHSDTTWPNTTTTTHHALHHLPHTTINKITHLNAQHLFNFTPTPPPFA